MEKKAKDENGFYFLKLWRGTGASGRSTFIFFFIIIYFHDSVNYARKSL
jgi:hypothetical protein